MALIVDKDGVLERIRGAKLDLGCGSRKRGPDYIGVDAVDHDGVDIVGDVFDVLARIPEASLDHVFSSHFMEHIDDVAELIKELGRVIRPGSTLETVVPHFSNPYYYSDPTHRTSFGLYSMSYFASHSPFKRQVPVYARPPVFRLISAELVFKSSRPFYARHALKRLTHTLVNFSRATKEFYEENASYWLPCYEIRFLMERVDPSRTVQPRPFEHTKR